LTSWLVIGGARFWASLDLLEYFELSNFKRGVVFPGLKRTKRLISIRLPEQLLVRVKDKANKLYTPYQNLGIVSKPVQKLVGKLTLFQDISQVLRHHKTT